MPRTLKWGVAILFGAVVFAVAWWVCTLFGLPNGDALAIAAIPGALLPAPVVWWAGRETAAAPPAAAEPQVVMGLIPHEPPNFQAMTQLATLADMSGSVCVIRAVTGQRGVGKTQLAAAHARRRVADGWLVAWIGAESPDLVTAGMFALADRLALRDPEDDAERATARIREHLQTRTEPALLVFDNLTDPDAIAAFLPGAGPTQVVVTSTARAAERMGRPVPVDVFDLDTALRFLREATGLDDDQGARALAAELGCLPLALAQAAARIRAGWDYATYLDRLRRFPVERHLTRRAGEQYPLGAPAAILLALEPFRSSQLLETLAFLSPDGISRDVLDPDPAVDSTVDAELERLYEASVIEFAGDATRAVTMHRLVQRVVRDRCHHDGSYPQVLARLTAHLESLVIDEEDAWRDKERGDELVRQVEALWDNCVHDPAAVDLSAVLSLRHWAVRHLIATAALSRAIPLADAVAKDTMDRLGADHPDSRFAADNLAEADRAAGRYGEAVPLYARILADSRRVRGPEHPDTFAAAANLASTLEMAGRPAEAIPLLERTLADLRRVLGDDEPDTLLVLAHLARANESAGRLAEAIPLHERAAAGMRRVLGEDDRATVVATTNLAHAYLATGRLSEAIALLEQARSTWRRTVGELHPDTLVSVVSLASAYETAGRADEAIPLLEAALPEQRRLLGDDHPTTLTTIGNLASAYETAGRAQEAIPLQEQALAGQRALLGDDHPGALISASNLGKAYWSAGRPADAIPLLERTLADARRVLGETHLDILTMANNLALAYAAAGRHDDAIPLYERTLADARRAHGEDHPDTILSALNLAAGYSEAGRSAAAQALFAKTLPRALEVLDESHPLAAVIRSLRAPTRRSTAARARRRGKRRK